MSDNQVESSKLQKIWSLMESLNQISGHIFTLSLRINENLLGEKPKTVENKEMPKPPGFFNENIAFLQTINRRLVEVEKNMTEVLSEIDIKKWRALKF